jgi:hypothetical protein
VGKENRHSHLNRNSGSEFVVVKNYYICAGCASGASGGSSSIYSWSFFYLGFGVMTHLP